MYCIGILKVNLLLSCCPLPHSLHKRKYTHAHTHLSQGRFLVPQANNEDAVSLADTALSPRGHAVVSLVQDNPVDVLLLGQPAGQTVLMDTDG